MQKLTFYNGSGSILLHISPKDKAKYLSQNKLRVAREILKI